MPLSLGDRWCDVIGFVRGSTSTGVSKVGCWILTHSSRGFPFHFSLFVANSLNLWGQWHVWSDCHFLRQSSGRHGLLLSPPLSSWRLGLYRLHCLHGRQSQLAWQWSPTLTDLWWTEPSVYTIRVYGPELQCSPSFFTTCLYKCSVEPFFFATYLVIVDGPELTCGGQSASSAISARSTDVKQSTNQNIGIDCLDIDTLAVCITSLVTKRQQWWGWCHTQRHQ